MKQLLLTVALVCGLLVARAEAQTSPACDQVPNLACVAGDTYTGTHNFSGATISLPAGAVDVITEIAVGLKSGADLTLVTGTAGASGNCAQWNVDGDLVDAGAGCGGTADNISVGGLAATDANFLDSTWIDFVLDTVPSPDTITANIIAGSITATELATDSVGAAEIAVGAVGSSEIATDAVEAAEIATGAVGTAEIADGVIVAADISDTGYLTWNEAATGTGNTRTIAAEPRQIVANRDAILVVGNGIVQRQVSVTPSLNEFTRLTTTLTWGAGFDPGNVVVWYELPN